MGKSNLKYKLFSDYKKSLTNYHSYELEERDKKTATTTFFSAIEKDSQRKVFIKRFNKKLDPYKEFQCEKYSLENLDQINIVKPIAIFENSSFGYIVYPFADGGDLFELFKNQEIVFNNNQLKMVAFNLLSALENIHSKGFIYRDLKLENVVLSRKFEDLILDFNSSDIQLIDFGSCYIESKSKSLQYFRCTSIYSPPEYLFHKKVTDKYDIFSLGVLLYYLASSYLPFNPNYDYDESEFCEMLSENNINKLFEEEEWKNISPEFINLVKSMLLFDDNMRPTSKELLKNDYFSDLISPYEFIEDNDNIFSNY